MLNQINSLEYWENRFDKDWKLGLAAKQTIFFGNLIINNLPEFIINDIEKNKLNICDFGCAEGDCAHILKKNFNFSNITGIDFSQTAINRAKEKYQDISFVCNNVDNLSGTFDVILTSNVLEHFEDPLTGIKKLLSQVDRHLVILVPFQEYNRHEEHLYTFDYNSFPLNIDDFTLSYFRVTDTSKFLNSFWVGKQALIVYTRKNKINPEDLTLASFIESKNIPVIEMIISGIIKKINEFKRFMYRMFVKFFRNIK